MDALYRVPEVEIVRAYDRLKRGDRESLESLKRPTDVSFDAALVRHLVQHTLTGRWKEPPQSDGWFASRVHAVIRLPRRLAADRGIWFWLATGAFREYVDWRFPNSKEWRYTGDLLRNAVSRLWWGAELLRDGPDYSLVPAGFRTVRTYMFVSELRYSRYREAARAFARVAAGEQGGEPLDDEAVQELSILFNTYLRLDALESHGSDSLPTQREWDPEWGARTPTRMELDSDDPKALIGPDGGYSDPKKEAAIVEWLSRLVPEARARLAEKRAREASEKAAAREHVGAA